MLEWIILEWIQIYCKKFGTIVHTIQEFFLEKGIWIDQASKYTSENPWSIPIWMWLVHLVVFQIQQLVHLLWPWPCISYNDLNKLLISFFIWNLNQINTWGTKSDKLCMMITYFPTMMDFADKLKWWIANKLNWSSFGHAKK